MEIDRRSTIAGLAGGALAGGAWSGEAAAGRSRRVGLIDVHRHYAPPAFLDVDRDQAWDGVAFALLSGFAPPMGRTVQDRRAAARATNILGARMVREDPRRFGLFASLPFPDLEGCLAEAGHGLDRLGAAGVAVYARNGGPWLGDPLFDPLHRDLNRRKAVVFIHPFTPHCCTNLAWGAPDPLAGYDVAATRTMGSLIFSGVTTRYPDIRFIFAHGDEAAPLAAQHLSEGPQADIFRAVAHPAWPPAGRWDPGRVLAHFERMFFDTAPSARPSSLGALRRSAPPSQILYGADYWRSLSDEPDNSFSPRELAAFGHNASRLMPSLPGKSAATQCPRSV